MIRFTDETEGLICVGCGLCCDGTLHGKATVRPDDETTVAAAGLEIGEEAGKRFFRQPCPHFSCGSCTIYSNRPKVCRTYRCALLLRLEEGKIGELAAREKIATAKKLLSAFRMIAPEAVTPAGRSAFVAQLKSKLPGLDGAARQLAQKALLDSAVLEYFLGRWFLKGEQSDAPADDS